MILSQEFSSICMTTDQVFNHINNYMYFCMSAFICPCVPVLFTMTLTRLLVLDVSLFMNILYILIFLLREREILSFWEKI